MENPVVFGAWLFSAFFFIGAAIFLLNTIGKIETKKTDKN